jgi:ABC-type multidrug transport system fused ATPase/permease subunit
LARGADRWKRLRQIDADELLLRFYDPQHGRVLIDGQDIRSVTTQSLRQTIGIVPQHPMLFRGTVRDNILYGRRGASEDEMREALERLAQGRTTFIIAQRLTVARTADLIVDMQNGEVVEQGVHDELIEHGDAYKRLWEQQMAAATP